MHDKILQILSLYFLLLNSFFIWIIHLNKDMIEKFKNNIQTLKAICVILGSILVLPKIFLLVRILILIIIFGCSITIFQLYSKIINMKLDSEIRRIIDFDDFVEYNLFLYILWTSQSMGEINNRIRDLSKKAHPDKSKNKNCQLLQVTLNKFITLMKNKQKQNEINEVFPYRKFFPDKNKIIEAFDNQFDSC